MTNEAAATYALAEALGRVVKEAVAEGIKPLEKRMDSLESRMDSLESRVGSLEESVREIHEMVQIPEAQERLAVIRQGVK